MTSECWQTVLDTVTAAGTVAAVVVAVVLADAGRRDRRRGQAARVTAWPGSIDSRTSGNHDSVVIANGSDSSVTDVLVGFGGAWKALSPDRPYWQARWLLSVPPGEWLPEGVQNDGESMDVRLGVFLEFTDSSGRRWRRSANGRLNSSSQRLLKAHKADDKPTSQSIDRL